MSWKTPRYDVATLKRAQEVVAKRGAAVVHSNGTTVTRKQPPQSTKK